MIGETSVYGVYLPWLMVLAVLALALSWAARRLLAALGFYRWVWHPALFDLAFYALLLYALSRFSGWLQAG
ncbi:MAG: DUF1656 domain-containing protein [Comamonas sp.]